MEKIFKAKRIDTGEWVEFGLFNVALDLGKHFKQFKSNTIDIFVGDSPVCIDKNTTCQYTGINDSEGNRIFEGDEVKGYQYEPDKPYIVRYNASKYNCGFVASDNEECNPYIHVWYEGLTLTGHNIHDRG